MEFPNVPSTVIVAITHKVADKKGFLSMTCENGDCISCLLSSGFAEVKIKVFAANRKI